MLLSLINVPPRVLPPQLRSFNLPYQLGYTNTVGVDGVAQYFETPGDADNSSIPLLKVRAEGRGEPDAGGDLV